MLEGTYTSALRTRAAKRRYFSEPNALDCPHAINLHAGMKLRYLVFAGLAFWAVLGSPMNYAAGMFWPAKPAPWEAVDAYYYPDHRSAGEADPAVREGRVCNAEAKAPLALADPQLCRPGALDCRSRRAGDPARGGQGSGASRDEAGVAIPDGHTAPLRGHWASSAWRSVSARTLAVCRPVPFPPTSQHVDRGRNPARPAGFTITVEEVYGP